MGENVLNYYFNVIAYFTVLTFYYPSVSALIILLFSEMLVLPNFPNLLTKVVHIFIAILIFAASEVTLFSFVILFLLSNFFHSSLPEFFFLFIFLIEPKFHFIGPFHQMFISHFRHFCSIISILCFLLTYSVAIFQTFPTE